MKTVRFKFVSEIPQGTLHACSVIGDMSGEYVPADDVRELEKAAGNIIATCPLCASGMKCRSTHNYLNAVLKKLEAK